MIKLGNKARDKVTGFEGIAISKIEYLNGCIQFCIKPKSDNGKMPGGEYIDIQQLEFIDDGVAVEAKPTGGENMGAPKCQGLMKN